MIKFRKINSVRISAHGKLGAKRVLSRRIHTACLPQFSLNTACAPAQNNCVSGQPNMQTAQ